MKYKTKRTLFWFQYLAMSSELLLLFFQILIHCHDGTKLLKNALRQEKKERKKKMNTIIFRIVIVIIINIINNQAAYALKRRAGRNVP